MFHVHYIEKIQIQKMYFKTDGQRRDISIQIWLFAANNEGVAFKLKPLNKKLAQGRMIFCRRPL